MKNRLVALLLCFSLVLGIYSNGKRAFAEPVTIVTVVGAAVVAAFALIATAAAAPNTSVSGLGGEFSGGGGMDFDFNTNYTFSGDSILNPSGQVVYHNNSQMITSLAVLSSVIQSNINSGSVTVDDGNVKFTYHDLQLLLAEANTHLTEMAYPSVEFASQYGSFFYNVNLSMPFALRSLPTYPQYADTSSSQSYAPIFFDDTRIIFSQYYIRFSKSAAFVNTYYLNSSYSSTSLQIGVQSGVTGDFEAIYSYNYVFHTPSLSTMRVSYLNWQNKNVSVDKYFDYCFVYDNSTGILTYTPISQVDVSGMSSGLVSSVGDYGSFLKSITAYTTSLIDYPSIDDIPVDLPDDTVISVPLDPDITTPIDDQIVVSIPGNPDITMTEAKEQDRLDLDIKVPPIILTKFPFSIPYDFIRFLEIFDVVPKAPVFRIPLSTNPQNISGLEGNETFGSYLNPDTPHLFEIDEEIVIDLSGLPLLQPICYTIFIVSFIFLLLHITTKMIQH